MIFTSSSQNDAAGAVDTGINIPSWFKDVAGFYSQGAMSDEALANNIEYLIKEAILVVPSSANYAEAKSIESALGEMQDRMDRMETMMFRNTGGNIDPSPMMGDLGGDTSLTDRVSKLETMMFGNTGGNIDPSPMWSDDDDGITDRVSQLETIMFGNTGGNIDPSPMWSDDDDGITDRVSKLETMLIDTVPLPESDLADRVSKLEIMMIGNTGGNIDPSPMITTTLGSLGDRVSKLETMLIDTVPLPESGLGDRVSKLETMLIDTVPLPESGIDVIQKTARHIIPAGASQGKVAYCDSGYIATGGGYRYVTANHHVSDNMPLSDLKGWKVWIKNNDKYNDIKVEVYAICMKLR